MYMPIVLTPMLAALLAHHGTPSDFMGVCTVTAIQNETDMVPFAWTTVCRLQDTPTPGYRNKWHVILYGTPPVPAFRLAPIADYIKAETILGGGVAMRSALWGEVRVMPIEETVRHLMAEHQGYEVRPQRMDVQSHEDGTIMISFWEPNEDFDVPAVMPSLGWQEDFLKSLRQLSRAH